MSIRNFAIIAHIDHGKSTLADRLLEITQTVTKRQMRDRLLDQMELEQEKGITIKLAPVSLNYRGHQLNLIDTPGHVDFSYEVSRSLQACEGALLVVDASQGIQAQTLANVYLALEHDLTIIPVINKIDLPAADVDACRAALVNLLGVGLDEILPISAKTGQGVKAVLQAVIDRIPAPQTNFDQTRGLIFDSYYDDFRGVVLYVRLVSGQIKPGESILMMATNSQALASEVGQFRPQPQPTANLQAGQIGYLVTNLKSTAQARVGDTVTLASQPAHQPLPGYQPARPFIFVGLFPVDRSDYLPLKKALAKLALTDSTLAYEPENSTVLGHGFRTGFLGLLHLDITIERLSREYQLTCLTTNPSTAYRVQLTTGQEKLIKTAHQLPDPSRINQILEPWVKGEMVARRQDVGNLIGLINQARGQDGPISYIANRAVLAFQAPLANLLTNFYDRLKSQTSGYASLNYQLDDYRVSDLVRLDFLIAGQLVPALSLICHRSEALSLGRNLINKLSQIIPRQQFKVAIQAAIGGKVIARADLASYRKDVTAKLYGGDPRRRQKLLEKQKKGKAKMKKIGQVELPADAFRALIGRQN